MESCRTRRSSILQRAVLAEEDDFRRVQRLGHLDRHRVRIDAVGFPVAVETRAAGRMGMMPLVEKKLQADGVHALDLAGVELVDAAEDAGGKRDDRVGVDGAQVHGWSGPP